MKVKKIFGVAILLGILESLTYYNFGLDVSFGKIVSKIAFGTVGLDSQYIPDFLYSMIPIIIFQILYGAYLYQHFCTASVYYFSRCMNRTKWFLYESVKLFFDTFLYQFVYWFFAGILTVLIHSIQINKEEFILFLITFIINIFWIFTTTLMVNILSIKTNLVTGFGIVFGWEAFCIAIYSSMESLFLSNLQDSKKNLFFFLWKWNPISQLVIKWHSSCNDKIDAMINFYSISFDLLWSVAYLIIFCIIVMVCGILVIHKIELLGNGREE